MHGIAERLQHRDGCHVMAIHHCDKFTYVSGCGGACACLCYCHLPAEEELRMTKAELDEAHKQVARLVRMLDSLK